MPFWLEVILDLGAVAVSLPPLLPKFPCPLKEAAQLFKLAQFSRSRQEADDVYQLCVLVGVFTGFATSLFLEVVVTLAAKVNTFALHLLVVRAAYFIVRDRLNGCYLAHVWYMV